MTLLEVQFLESEVSLHDASGLDPGSQHILLGGDIICFSYPLQVVQVTETETETGTGTDIETDTERKKVSSVIFQLAKTKRPTQHANAQVTAELSALTSKSLCILLNRFEPQ